MAKAKESKAEQQQRSDAAEQAHRLWGWSMLICMRFGLRTDMSMDITIQIPKRFPIDWQEPLDIWKQ